MIHGPFRPISLRLSCFSVWCFPHLGCMMSRRRPTAIPSKYAFFKVSPVGIHNTCSNAFCGAFLPIWVSKSAGVAPLSPRFLKLLDESQDLRCLSIVSNNFSIVTTIAYCPFHQARGTFTTADGKVAKSDRCLSTGAFALFCHVFMVSRKVCSSFIFVLRTRLSARFLLSSRPDTASFRSCLLLPPGFLDTREAGI